MSLVGFRARNHPQQEVVDDVDDRGTPDDLFWVWNERWHFTVDAAAAAHNAKLPRFWTIEDDGLAQPWSGERVWCNPPYSRLTPWVAKASRREAELCVMLLPANRTEQNWWQRYIEPDRREGRLSIEFLPGRIRFHRNGAEVIKPNERPPFGNCLVIWDGREMTDGD